MRLVVVRVPAAEAESAADRLRQAGAWAIEERGTDPVELRTVVAADDDEARAQIGSLPSGWWMTFEDAADNASEAWRDHAHHVVVSEHLTIHPAWRPVPIPGTSSGEEHIDVVIEPGAAFGLGDHPTTQLAAAAVERVVRPGNRVLDVGCGSGVLSIVAARRGATVVEAIDISAAAVAATLDNAARNAVEERVFASTLHLTEIGSGFDVVVANILAPELIALAPDLRRVTAPAGRLIVSGVLADRHSHVLRALEPMVVVATTMLDEWAAIELIHT